MQTQNGFSAPRLLLYLAIGTLPAIVEWLTLNFDTSPRGILILVAKTALTAAITAKAYVDPGSPLDTKEKKHDPDTQEPPPLAPRPADPGSVVSPQP